MPAKPDYQRLETTAFVLRHLKLGTVNDIKISDHHLLFVRRALEPREVVLRSVLSRDPQILEHSIFQNVCSHSRYFLLGEKVVGVSVLCDELVVFASEVVSHDDFTRVVHSKVVIKQLRLDKDDSSAICTIVAVPVLRIARLLLLLKQSRKRCQPRDSKS